MSHKTQRSQDFPDGSDAHLKSPSEGLWAEILWKKKNQGGSSYQELIHLQSYKQVLVFVLKMI